MVKNVKKLISLFLVIICGGLVYYIVDVIKTKNTEYELISGIDSRVIEKLQTIREMEKAYFAVNNKFTDNWDTLKLFVQTGQFIITDRKEEIISRAYGGDSVVVTIDTLGTASVKDSLFNGVNKPDLNEFYLSPETKEPFLVTVSQMGNESYIEVKDAKPLNPDRKKGGKLKPLKFGSISESTLRGNWEK